MKYTFSFLLILCTTFLFAQQNKQVYKDSLAAFQKRYIAEHEIVKGTNKKYFRFFSINQNFEVKATFKKLTDTVGFTMKTSANTLQKYFKYGSVNFMLNKKSFVLFIYQSPDLMKTEKYKDYLFLPFTDESTGDETYGSGRYIDLRINDIKNNSVIIDFNKAYNPYCAYATGFHCPIPHKENYLATKILAGEKNFAKTH